MIRIFKHYIPQSVFILGLAEIAILFFAIQGALKLRYNQLNLGPIKLDEHIPEVGVFVGVVYVAMLAVGVYRLETCRDLRVTILRLVIALLVSFILMSVIFYIFPTIDIWRSVFTIALSLGLAGILIARIVFIQVVDINRFKRRVLVLGASRRAKRIEDLSKENAGQNFTCVGFVAMGRAPVAIDTPEKYFEYEEGKLQSLCERLRVDEIVVAIEERRGTLPVSDLLDAKISGIKVLDSTTFLERETGVVDLDSVNPSWLIFSDGFGQGGQIDLMFKRLFDIFVSVLILLLTAPILILAAIAVKVTSPGPVFYLQDRVGFNGRVFPVMKFRSMRNDAEKDGPVWAQQGDARVTPVGRFIRATRIDEIPQIFNVLMGHMSFVGPRPERPFFVESLEADINFYQERHRVKPGITGWAQINYPYGASVEDSRRKLQYDLYYIKNYSVFLDFLILVQTVRVIIWPDGVR